MQKVPANVKFIHCRNIDKDGKIQTHGGMTIAYVLNEQCKVVGWAAARCHEKDRFIKAQGRAKAAGRLNSGRYYQDCVEKDEKVFIEESYAGYKKFFNTTA